MSRRSSDIDELLRRAENPEPLESADVSSSAPVDAETKHEKKSETATSADTERPKVDGYIAGCFIALCAISVVELYSASSREVTASNVFGPLIRHVLMLLMGITICFGVSRLKMSTVVRFTPYFVALSVLMMIYVLLNGQIINGARRSFSLAGIQIQPSEFLKISAVLIIAYIMAKNQIKGGGVKTRGIVLSAGIVIFFGALLFSQGLTNTLVLMSISLSMMALGGIEWRKFFLVLGFYALIGGIGLVYKMHSANTDDATIMTEGVDAQGNRATINRANSVWKGRMSRYFGGDSLPKYKQPITALNRQEMYSYMAQANGGLTGVMPGNSRETARLPLAFSDYIYSIIVEDWGFIGGVVLLFIYISVVLRAGALAYRCSRAFPALLEMGMAIMVAIQALCHIGITTGALPVSGQPLPMISKGGSSMLITSIAFGIMLGVSRYALSKKDATKGKRIKSDLPPVLDAANPTGREGDN